MNLLYTTVGKFDSFQSQELIKELKRHRHIVELLPMEHIIGYLRFAPRSSMALVDAIICDANVDLIKLDLETESFLPTYPLEKALMLAEDVYNLPESCTMRDGRKWRAIPFIIFRNGLDYYQALLAREQTHAQIVFTPYNHPPIALRQIREIVDEYQERVLSDYETSGIMVRFERGRAQIRPALRSKAATTDTKYYYSPGDRREIKGWITVSRDSQGLSVDIEMFLHLIDTGASETRMHQFFEENPAFLMEARMGIPISHRPAFAHPKNWKPDFAFTTILGLQHGRPIELLELKGPSERILSNGLHSGLSARVHRAVDQVRDYDRCLRAPENLSIIQKAFGCLPDSSKLAVLIGRRPKDKGAAEVLLKRQEELNVEVITYDEILQTQTSQLESSWFGY